MIKMIFDPIFFRVDLLIVGNSKLHLYHSFGCAEEQELQSVTQEEPSLRQNLFLEELEIELLSPLGNLCSWEEKS